MTVIIEHPVKGKQVVVIPKPSPWLVELLTGEKTGAPTMATTPGTQVSATRVRNTSGRGRSVTTSASPGLPFE